MSDAADDGDEDRQWRRLLEWLATVYGMDVDGDNLRVVCRGTKDAGRGLFAVGPCQPSTTLFTIPAKAMINVKTLAPLYATKTLAVLSPIQLVSMHIFLHRPGPNEESRDPTFGPYISTLPQEFSSHPLSWTVTDHKRHATHKALITSLPDAVSLALHEIRQRYWEDWQAVCKHLQESPRIVSNTSVEQIRNGVFNPSDSTLQEHYLWAWLNVNTRCIYYQLHADQSAPENFAMCPILDFANHAPLDPHIMPVLPSTLFAPPRTSRSRKKPVRALGGDYMFISSGRPIHKDDELYLQYGAHSNSRLFVEYGFVNSWTPGACLRGDFSGEVDLQGIIEDMFQKRDASVGAWMRRVLEDEGYWGDWTMHSSPTPAHPSYRLIAALRLYHIVPKFAMQPPDDSDELISAWRNTLVGKQECISATNEQAWRQTLIEICERVVVRAKSGIQDLTSAVANLHDGPEWLEWMVGNIELLWREEHEVAEAVVVSVRSGEDF